jgi:hypothetical protein
MDCFEIHATLLLMLCCISAGGIAWSLATIYYEDKLQELKSKGKQKCLD